MTPTLCFFMAEGGRRRSEYGPGGARVESEKMLPTRSRLESGKSRPDIRAASCQVGSGMRCLVTAGPTYEPLDLVRRITNFSTGSLGTMLAAELAARGHSVLLLRGVLSSAPLPPPAVETRPFTSTDDLASRFLELATDEPIAVLHAAAVSDFAPARVYAQDADTGRLIPIVGGKYPTTQGRLMVELKPTPKLLNGLRDWYPAARIIGWKYEVEGGPGDALQRAEAQLASARSDAVVVNGPAWGPGFGFLRPGQSVEPLRDSMGLAERIAAFLSEA